MAILGSRKPLTRPTPLEDIIDPLPLTPKPLWERALAQRAEEKKQMLARYKQRVITGQGTV
jgi:hypothetical protein